MGLKEFIPKYLWLLVLIICLVSLVALLFYKKDFSKNYISIAAVFLIIVGIATVFSFLVLQSGLAINNDIENTRTRKEITNSVNKAVVEIIEKQGKGLGGIQSKVESVNQLLETT